MHARREKRDGAIMRGVNTITMVVVRRGCTYLLHVDWTKFCPRSERGKEGGIRG